MATLGSGGARRPARRFLSDCARERTGRLGKPRPDRLDQPLPVAQRYPELFEIIFRQLRQHVAIDRILDECLLVLSQPKFSQPAANVHDCPNPLQGSSPSVTSAAIYSD